jgi:hypothetical protein
MTTTMASHGNALFILVFSICDDYQSCQHFAIDYTGSSLTLRGGGAGGGRSRTEHPDCSQLVPSQRRGHLEANARAPYSCPRQDINGVTR